MTLFCYCTYSNKSSLIAMFDNRQIQIDFSNINNEEG